MIPALNTQERKDALRPFLEEQGRILAEIDVIAEAQLSLARTHDEAEKKYRESRLGRFQESQGRDVSAIIATNWIGTPMEAVEKINVVKEEGITHFNALHITGDTVQEMTEQMQIFAEEVMPLVS